MANTKQPIYVLPFCGLTFSNQNTLSLYETYLEKLFSPIQNKSEILDFSRISSYYDNEMGSDLKKIFYYFKELVSPDDFHLNKIKTNNYETKSCKENITDNSICRTINIDPGYITEAKLILFSAKDFSHRVYIGHGIYGEVQLSFKKDSFTGLFWSYPDYKNNEIISFINQGRQYLRKCLGKK